MSKKVKGNPKKQIPVTGILLGVVGILLAAIIIYAIYDAQRPAPVLGESFPIASREHIPFGQKSIDYNSDPPTSGQHYDQPATPGYYDVAPPDEQLVHNLEHGYVVIYFNCDADASVDCAGLTQELQQDIRGEGISRFTRTPKLIVAPRPGMGNLITYTSWGHLYRQEDFDRSTMQSYIDLYLDKAPEPNAQ